MLGTLYLYTQLFNWKISIKTTHNNAEPPSFEFKCDPIVLTANSIFKISYTATNKFVPGARSQIILLRGTTVKPCVYEQTLCVRKILAFSGEIKQIN